MSEQWSGRKVTTARARLAATLPAPCYRCGVTIPSAADCKELGIQWDVDHATAQAEGGAHTLDNLVVSHRGCNRSHGGKLGNARKSATVAVRAAETERTTKFWKIAKLEFENSFFLKCLITLRSSPLIFVFEGAN